MEVDRRVHSVDGFLDAFTTFPCRKPPRNWAGDMLGTCVVRNCSQTNKYRNQTLHVLSISIRNQQTFNLGEVLLVSNFFLGGRGGVHVKSSVFSNAFG